MSLPPAFSNDEDYFTECMTFLLHYRELFWKSNTDVLLDNLDFHIQLVKPEDVGQQIEDVEEYSEFFHDLERLSPCYENIEFDNVHSTVKSPMSQKKAHEVVHLTEEIKDVCRSVDCETVVDLGAGLGYIDLQIFEKTGFNVLGLEGKESFYVNAKQHQRKYYSNSLSRVKYIRHVVSENSDTNIKMYLKDKFPDDDKGFCFMGLHACGDLTVSAINLFIKMQNSRALVVTPCCYHKMAVATDNTGTDSVYIVKNFPLSTTLRKVYEKFKGCEFLHIPFLRMAAQPSHIKDEDINDRLFCLLARALLNVYARKYNCQVQKKRRKAVRLTSMNRDFGKYAEEAATKGFKLIPDTENKSENTEIEFNATELQSMWEKIPQSTLKNAALYISYQNHMPPIFENIILYDRLVYLREHGINNCYFKKVVNEKISPKCLSLVAMKDNVVSSTANVVSSTENVVSCTENVVSFTANVVSSTENVVSCTENVSIPENLLSNIEKNGPSTENPVLCALNSVSIT